MNVVILATVPGEAEDETTGEPARHPSPHRAVQLRPNRHRGRSNSPTEEGLALPKQLSDSGKRCVNTRPTLRGSQPLLHVSLLERREGEGAVRSRAQRFGPYGFLSHQRQRGGEDFILAVLRVAVQLLTLLLLRRVVGK